VLEVEGKVRLPFIHPYASNNGHMFYMVCQSIEQRQALIGHLKSKGIHAVFHYLSLHKSPFYQEKHDGRILENCDMYADRLVRLPAFYELALEDIEEICAEVIAFFQQSQPVNGHQKVTLPSSQTES
ncbi:MAG: DegT/DnrJ/EryC1/StrS family aminotransferase, partial [Bacteroidota bacterium]